MLGIRKGNQDLFAVAQAPTTTQPILLSGSTALDPTRLARIRARFAPARVVEIGQVQDLSGKSGQTELRELRPGDRVRKGQILGVFYSVDVGSKKNDLLDALVQLILDQKTLDDVEEHPEAFPRVFLNTQVRMVQGDRNAITRAWNNLKAWDIPQDEIDALQQEAVKMSADKNVWMKTPEGKWVEEKQANSGSAFDIDNVKENPWEKVTLRAPFDGVLIERNVGACATTKQILVTFADSQHRADLYRDLQRCPFTSATPCVSPESLLSLALLSDLAVPGKLELGAPEVTNKSLLM